MKIGFYLLDATYKVIDGKPVIHLFGKTADDKQICVLYDKFRPYFYVISENDLGKELESFKIRKNDEEISIIKTERVKRRYFGKDVQAFKVFVKLPGHVPILREELKNWNNISSVNENDILFVRRFLIDYDIVPLELYEIEGDFVDMRLKVPCFKAETFSEASSDEIFKPKILSVDIETYTPRYMEIQPEKNPIIMIAFYGEDFKKSFCVEEVQNQP